MCAPVDDGGASGGMAEEGQTSRGLRAPNSPSDEEREAHNRSHIPYRSWCDACVRGRGRAHAHASAVAPGRYSEAQICADYCFMGGMFEEGREKIPVIVLYEKCRKSLYAHTAPTKGPDPRVVKQITADLEAMGIKRAVHKTDQEPAIVALWAAIRAEWDGELVPETSPIGDSDSNGAAESAVQQHEGLTRTHNLALQGRLGVEISDDSVVMQWLVEWAANMHRRFNVAADGQTPFQRIRGKTAERPIVEFGERVLAQELRAGDDGRSNTEPRFEEGAVLGIDDRSDEVIVHTADGLKRCRNIQRRPGREQWSRELVLSVARPGGVLLLEPGEAHCKGCDHRAG